MALANESRIQYLISRFQKSIFALVLHLVGGDPNAAYDVTVSAFVKVLKAGPLFEDNAFFLKLVGAAIEQSRGVHLMPVADDIAFGDFPAERRKLLQIMKTALLTLPFEAKVPLLLRDQMHLPYQAIGAVMKMSEKDARLKTNEARGQMRKKIEELMKA